MTGNKGQALIIFVLFLPLFLLILAYILDSSRLVYEKNKVTSIGNMALKYVEKDNELTNDGIEQLIKMNDKDIKVSINDKDGMKIQLVKEINSIFSKVSGQDKYIIRIVVEKE